MGHVDVDGAARFDGVELDLLDFVVVGGGGGAFGFDFGGAGFDAGEGAGDVVREDFLGLMVGGCDPESVGQLFGA